jgi:Biotin-lipoyl like
MAALPRAALRLTRVTTLVAARLRGVDRGRQRGTNSCRYRCPSWQRSRLTLLDMATLRLTNAPSKHRCRCGGGTARPFRYRTFAIDYSGRPISRYSVVPRVAGYVTALHVTDNSHFRANELLVEIDPRDFEVAVKTAEVNLQSARAAKSNVQRQLAQQTHIIAAAKATRSGAA